jgi:hypothetical protein
MSTKSVKDYYQFAGEKTSAKALLSLIFREHQGGQKSVLYSMIKKIIILSLSLYLFPLHAQTNLVPNASFDVYSTCPPGVSYIFDAPPWFQPQNYLGTTYMSGSSDLYDTCTNPSEIGIPFNWMGHQPSRTGKGYAGFYTHADTMNYREYIEVPLISALVTGQTYCVSFYVSLGDTSQEAISNIGAYFSVDSLLYDNIYLRAIDTVTPQVENPTSNMLSDKNNWMLVSGSFIAVGGEKFMTIGNFHKPINTNSVYLGPGAYPGIIAYYYIDDVDVHCCGKDCSVGVNELGIRNEELGIYPNPTTGVFTIHSEFSKIKEVRVYNLLGCEILKQVQNDQSATIDINSLSQGIYFIEAQTEKGIIRKKIVKQ